MILSVTAATVSVGALCVWQWRGAQMRAAPKSSAGDEGLVPAWLDDDAMQVLSAVCDAFLPHEASGSFSREQIAAELVRSAGKSLAGKTVSEIEALFPRVFEAMATPSVMEHHVQRGALDANVPARVARLIGEVALEKDRRDLYMVLRALSTSVGCFLITGHAIPFQHLSLEKRTKCLGGLRDSVLQLKRAVYHSFKRLTGFFFLAFAEGSAANPSWPAMRFDHTKAKAKVTDTAAAATASTLHTGDGGEPNSPPTPLSLLQPDENNEISCDVVIVGSGAGGGMMAYQLAHAGFQVCVVEKGSHYSAEDFAKWGEAEAVRSMYERGGLCSSADGNIVLLAGSTVGGGTTVNWSASFRTPEVVLQDWAENHGLAAFAPDAKFAKCLDTTLALLRVNTDHSHREGPSEGTGTFVVNKNNQELWRAATAVGLCPQKIPRNVQGCIDCGSCTHGCSHNAKQSTYKLMETLLHPNNGSSKRCLHLIPDCHAERILFDNQGKGGRGCNPRAIGVACTLKDGTALTIRAAVTVSSCGALHTPALLLRSQLRHPLIGKHLALHPVLGVVGVVNDLAGEATTGLSRGVGMGVVAGRTPAEQSLMGMDVTRCPRDKTQHSIALQTPPLHPGLVGLAMPWNNGLAFKLNALLYPNMTAFIGISRDRSCRSNCITIDAQGQPVINYAITAQDKPLLLHGLLAQLRVMRASGAVAFFPMTEGAPWFVKGRGGEEEEKEEEGKKFEAYLQQVKQAGVVPLKNLCFSAHQMGSCRMGATRSAGPVQPTGETYDVTNLFVADASIFPTSLGINPMITIEALSVMISANVVARLKELNVSPTHQNHELDW